MACTGNSSSWGFCHFFSILNAGGSPGADLPRKPNESVGSIWRNTSIPLFLKDYFPRFPLLSVQFSSLSRVQLFATPWIAAHQASLSITNSRNSLRLTSIESVMPSSHLMLCRPLLLLPPIPPSIRVFSNESTLHMRWPKYWSFRRQVSFNSLKCFSACVKKSPCGKLKKFKTKLY